MTDSSYFICPFKLQIKMMTDNSPYCSLCDVYDAKNFLFFPESMIVVAYFGQSSFMLL